VAGEQRANMQVPDLLDMCCKVRGEELADDSLLLN
ncbi:ABC transporter ATP-binding protein, partial [Vibrio parahaemolyticus]|nr:ABC transporter ATP-binding protein [Vibrio parahaemolyticus]